MVAATNRDLAQAVAKGTFRDDLYYRLNVVPITLVPLRDRREDIPLLVEHLLERLGAEQNRQVDGVSAEAMALLVGHDWPGNIRELRNVLERAMVVTTARILQAGDLGLTPGASGPLDRVGPLSLADLEKRHIANVLRHASGNISQAARILGIDRVTLYNKMRKYQIPRHQKDVAEVVRS